MSTSAGYAYTAQLTQLQQSVEAELDSLGVSAANLQNASLSDLALIKNIIESGHGDSQSAQINRILGNTGVMHMSGLKKTSGGNSEMANTIQQDLESIGITNVNANNLTVGQLAEIKSLFDDRNYSKDAVMAAIRGHDTASLRKNSAGESQLAAAVNADLESAGVTNVNANSLTLSQLTALKSLFDEGQGPSKEQIMMIVK